MAKWFIALGLLVSACGDPSSAGDVADVPTRDASRNVDAELDVLDDAQNTSTEPVSPETFARGFCAHEVQAARECRSQVVDAAEQRECERFYACVATNVKPEIRAPIIACLENEVQCNPRNPCVHAPTGYTPSNTAQRYRSRCYALGFDCNAIHNYCFAGIYNDAIVGEFEACLSLGCEEATACLERLDNTLRAACR